MPIRRRSRSHSTTTERSSDFLSGERFLAEVVVRLRGEIAAAGNPAATLATVLVSDDPRDLSNARRKHVWAEKAGMHWRHRQFAADASQAAVENAIVELANDAAVDGIFLQYPVPPSLDMRGLLARIPTKKNVDAPVPATPYGIVRLLEFGEVRTTGATAVIVGSSGEIAIPLARLLSDLGNRVKLIGGDSGDLSAIAREADILVSAAERPKLIRAEHVKPGAAVVDAGYNRVGARVVGDVDLESVERIAGTVVPMPGGTGPATIACLLERTWEAARRATR